MKELMELATFVAVVDCNSFTVAAKNVGLSKTATSEYVTRLETRLGVKFIHRTTRKLSLTEAGVACYQDARRMVVAARDAQNAATAMHSEPVGLLRVSCPESFNDLHLGPLMGTFQRLYPQVSVQLKEDVERVDVIGDHFDVAIRIGALPDSNLLARKLAEHQLLIVGSPEFLAEHGEPRTIADLVALPAVQFGPLNKDDRWQIVDPSGAMCSASVNIRVISNSGVTLKHAAMSGAGLALLPNWLVADELEKGSLCHVMKGWGSEPSPITALYAGNGLVSAKVTAIVEFLSKKMRGRWTQV